ncbi:MAG: M56 family metallopeptidase [Alphaproteobacteria bacterium]|nr:MAG: M56 family metallopeptidase [Alphaproteobacteria bacterium]
MMTELFTDLPIVGLFLKFMVASTVLLGSVWLLERLNILKLPDLSELAWKLAVGAAFVAVLPIGDWLSGPITIHHSEARALVEQFEAGRPIRGDAKEKTMPEHTVGQWFPMENTAPAMILTQEDHAQLKAVLEDRSAIIEKAQEQLAQMKSGGLVLRVSPEQTLVLDEKSTQQLERDAASVSDRINNNIQNKAPGFTVRSATPAPQTNGIIQPEADSEETITSTLEQWVAALSYRDLATLGWGLIALMAVFALCMGYRSAIRDLGTRSRVDAEHPANQALRALCTKVDIKHVPYLSRSSDIHSPVCLPRREICLPDWVFDALPEAELKSLLAHELGHMVRRDPLMLMIMQLLSRLFFFQPLFSVARRRLSDLAELSADEWAARQLENPRAVAAALFTCATKIHDSRNIQWGLAMAGNKSMLKKRVERLVGARGAHFNNASTAAKGLVMAGVLGLALGLPSVQFADALSITAATDEPMVGGDDDEARAKAEAKAAKAEAKAKAMAERDRKRMEAEIERATRVNEREIERAARQAEREARRAELAVRDMERDHEHRDDGRRTSIHMNDDSGNIVFVDDDYVLKAKWDGAFTLNKEMNAIADMRPDSWLDIRTIEDGDKRRVHIEKDGDKLVETYWVDGDKKAMDDGGRKWLAKTLDTMTRETGWMAAERIDALLKKGGTKAVLAEIKSARTDYIKRLYTQHLIELANLKDKEIEDLVEILATMDSDYELRNALTMLLTEEKISDKIMPKVLAAAKSIDSDYELRQLLTPYLQRFPLDDRSTGILIELAEHMDSDYEIRNLLTVALHDRNLSKKNVERLVKIATENIDSDYEMRQMLGAFATQLNKSTDATRTLFGAAAGMDSDYEKRMTIDLLISEGAMDIANWGAAIETASGIDSDYEKSESLTHIRAMMPDNADLKKRMETAIRGIDSDYHRKRMTGEDDRHATVPPVAPVPAVTPTPSAGENAQVKAG